jgi:hypothetical protein
MRAVSRMLAFSSLALVAAFVGCASDKPAESPESNDGPVEKAGESVDEAAEDTKEGAEEAADKVEEGAEDAVEAVKDAGS